MTKIQPTVKKKLIWLLLGFFTLIFGFWLGLFVGVKVQPRSVLMLNKCQKNCLQMNEILGLVGSVGIELNGQKILSQKENDSCFSIKMPLTELKTHYVLIPKKDIRDLGDMSEENLEIVKSCIKIATEYIQEEKLTSYQFTSNGPDYQHVRYLHFHIKSVKE
jgi:hypothetical protein